MLQSLIASSILFVFWPHQLPLKSQYPIYAKITLTFLHLDSIDQHAVILSTLREDAHKKAFFCVSSLNILQKKILVHVSWRKKTGQNWNSFLFEKMWFWSVLNSVVTFPPHRHFRNLAHFQMTCSLQIIYNRLHEPK